MKCRNLYCLHNLKNCDTELESWNDTDCAMYSIDPFSDENPTGFDVTECKARKRYEYKKGVFMIDYDKLKKGDLFFVPHVFDTKSCKTVYRNVKKVGLNVTIQKMTLDGTSGVQIKIL
ncbi:MAG: hypothetical protein HQK96_07590 [Nitrospirae bacterium]|nr:hypothetical protein [Nitrospirota bacterium]